MAKRSAADVYLDGGLGAGILLGQAAQGGTGATDGLGTMALGGEGLLHTVDGAEQGGVAAPHRVVQTTGATLEGGPAVAVEDGRGGDAAQHDAEQVVGIEAAVAPRDEEGLVGIGAGLGQGAEVREGCIEAAAGAGLSGGVGLQGALGMARDDVPQGALNGTLLGGGHAA